MKIQRGEVYFIKYYDTVGSEQHGNRPAIIVSNNRCNDHSPVVEVVYLSTRIKNNLPTHVEINSTPNKSVALCEQIHSIDISRIENYMCTLSDKEMWAVDRALLISVGLL